MRTETARNLIFPLTHFPQIEKAARVAQIDPVLGLSLVKQESAFDPEAVSSSGALGFAQLMPFTALDVRTGLTRSAILDPQQNLEIGFLYLRKLLDRWKGNVALALASYNAGPAAVERWVRANGVLPALDPAQPPLAPREANLELAAFVDRIPYKETRDYVGSILRNVLWYRSLLKLQNPSTLSDEAFLVPSFWRRRVEKPVGAEKKAPSPKSETADTRSL